MKKLIAAVLLAGAMVSVSEGAEVKPEGAAVEAVARPTDGVKRGSLTPEERAEMRARHEKMIAERRAEMEKKSLEIIKKYGLDDEKAKALLKELQESMRPMRRPRPVRPVAAKQAPKAE